MLTEQGIVVKANDEFVWVQTQRYTSCQHCGANTSCATASLSKVLGQKASEIKVANQLGVNIGDKVTVGLEEAAFIKTSLLLYLLPLLSLFAAAIGYQSLATYTFFPDHDLLRALAGLIGLGLSLKWVQHIAPKMTNHYRYQPVLLNVDEVSRGDL